MDAVAPGFAAPGAVPAIASNSSVAVLFPPAAGAVGVTGGWVAATGEATTVVAAGAACDAVGAGACAFVAVLPAGAVEPPPPQPAMEILRLAAAARAHRDDCDSNMHGPLVKKEAGEGTWRPKLASIEIEPWKVPDLGLR